MNELISPKYQMELIGKIEKSVWDEYSSYKQIMNYIAKWHECDLNWENFRIEIKQDGNIDLNKTFHSMPGDIILKIAVDMGVDTPDFIPSIPIFKNKLKSSYKTAYSTFCKACKQVESDPSIAVGLANSALESIVKEILKDDRINNKIKGTETLYKLTGIILKEFKLINDELPKETRTIGSSLLAINQAVEKLRSKKTDFHGKTSEDYLIIEPVYAYFIVNTVTTVGLFMNSFYKLKLPKSEPDEFDEIPF